MNNQPNFHDGHVDGVFNNGSEVHVFLRDVSGEKFTLVLRGVEALQIMNFKQKNVILNVELLAPADLEPAEVREIYQYKDEDLRGSTWDEWIQKADQRALQAISISSSYGCKLIATVKHVEYLRGYLTKL
jgi:hypothetical protein